MISFENVTKSYRTNSGRRYVFRNLSFNVPSGKNVAIIGRNGAGKSTIMRLLGGQDSPDSGRITSSGRISWPVGLSGGFQGSLSGRENVKFVCRVHGLQAKALSEKVAFVEDFADIGNYFDLPVNSYSSGMRARVAFGLSLAFHFDYYLVDEALSVGDMHFKKKAADAFKDRVDGSKLILVTHGMSQVKSLCDCVLVLDRGKVVPFEDVDEGIQFYKSLV